VPSPTGIPVLRGLAVALMATLLRAELPLGGDASSQARSTLVGLPPSA